ncbi:atrial natriuretic peptide receptor 1-like [Paramacrobiotus metropolitanus]|uniref:atrial natriuretic peptide receptor 1-like n=1 Tax=Paramacrobiotus metropolitanus TaxID=2943436 RepID=UPI002445794B|nr:atrial natriuretic peptide receptor 1-like [Paramacrobiotus metropolitanus]
MIARFVVVTLATFTAVTAASKPDDVLQLRLVSFLPVGSSDYFDYMYSAAAVNLTVANMNRQHRGALVLDVTWLPILHFDSAPCGATVADTLALLPPFFHSDQWAGRCLALIGENCSGIVEMASLAAEWNVPLFDILPNEPIKSQPDRYPTAVVPHEGYDNFLGALTQLLHIKNWRHGCVVIDRQLALSQAAYFWELGRTFANLDQRLQEQQGIYLERRYYDTDMNGSVDFRSVLQPCRGYGYSVILILADTYRTAELLLTASALGMGNGDTAFWPLVPSGSPLHNKTVLAHELRHLTDLTLRSVVYITWSRTTPWFSSDDDSHRLRSYARQAFIRPPSPALEPEELLSVFNTKFVIKTWANVALETFRQGGDPCDGRSIAAQVRQRFAVKVDAREAVEEEDSQPDAATVRIQAWKPSTGKFVTFLMYNGTTQEYEWTSLDVDDWPVPFSRDPNGQCGYDADSPYCKPTPLVPAEFGAIGLITLLFIPLLIAHVNRRIKIQRENSQEWILPADAMELTPLETGAKAASHEAHLHGVPVWCVPVPLTKHSQPEKLRRDSYFGKLYLVKHDNVNGFLGLCFLPKHVWIICQYAKRGSLGRLLQVMDTDWEFRLSFTVDLIQGLQYVHSSPVKAHGNLSMSTCLVDHRFVAKIGCLGCENIRAALKDTKYSLPNFEHRQHASASKYSVLLASLWAADVAAFRAVVMALSRAGWAHVRGEARQHFDMQAAVEGFAEEAGRCATMTQVEAAFKAAFPGQRKSPVESLIDRLAGYTEVLEHAVAERTAELVSEQEHCDRLLEQMLPRPVVQALRSKHAVEAELFECATICFTSLPGFVPWVASVSAPEVIDLLHAVYTLFDDEISRFDVHKMETIADGYLVASGIPLRNGSSHAPVSCRMAQSVMKRFVAHLQPAHRQLSLRVGIHSGTCAAGVIGKLVPRYCLFGDAVNTSSRMESHGESGKIHASHDTVQLLAELQTTDIVCVLRGQIPIKGKGFMTTYWIIS